MSPLLNPLAGLGEFNSTSEVTDTTEILQGWCCEVNSISVVSATAAALRAEPGFVVPVQFPTFSHSDGRGVSLAVSKLPASLPSQCGDTGSRQQVVSAKSWRSSSSSESSTASSMLGSTLRKEPLWLRPAAMHATVPIPPAAAGHAHGLVLGVSCCCCLSSSSSSSSVSTSSSNTSATSNGGECATGGQGAADTSHTDLCPCRTSSAVAASAEGLLVREGDFRTEDSGTNA